MALQRDNVPLVSLAVSAAALYARAVSSRVRPGFSRFVMLLPVTAIFAAVPLAFSSAILRCIAALFLTWLGTFKVMLLAAGRGPLEPGLPVLQFLCIAALPIELTSSRPAAPPTAPSKPEPVPLVSCTFKVAAIATILHLYRFFDRLHLCMRLALCSIHIWLSMEVLFTGIAAACSALGGMEVKPQFVRPYLATSLRDFWGRRWNLAVSAVLRASVYNPLRARAGKEAGILATFLVSGLMHEALVCYSTLQHPTGEMAAFFLLHGACRVAEDWCARRWEARGWPPPPRPVATLLVWAFMTTTSFWLIFLPVCREGRKETLFKQSEGVAAFFAGTGRKLLGYSMLYA